ncbi:hypothetical protein F0562_030432 [Nyssa sinensis]|uniref:AP2/ERF domain-containing protein n=1 Tax=Nyssa sinensis TaxID=561372 RepID=A0A5J5B0Y8_9ASTE|nr:hypothetical protein F0562_030432 [Nyssa sinensis]
MAKLSQQKQNSNANNAKTKTNSVTKVKRTRKTVPRDSPPQRSSIYRGVTRHCWTGRYEAHLWDKNCWNESQNKKGRQGAYDDEETAAHAYDLAALKYWGQETILNFPLSTYQNELKEMEGQSREEYIGSLRRHHHNGRWEARIGRVFGNKYLYLGTYATQEEAAVAYDMAAIEYRGLNAVTNFDLSRYIKWLRPNQNTPNDQPNNINMDTNLTPNPSHDIGTTFLQQQQQQQPPPSNIGDVMLTQSRPANATSAVGLLLQSSKFKEMMQMNSAADHECPPTPPPESDPPRFDFPDDIQTYFESQDFMNNYGEGDDIIFGELNSFMQPMLECDFNA